MIMLDMYHIMRKKHKIIRRKKYIYTNIELEAWVYKPCALTDLKNIYMGRIKGSKQYAHYL